MIETIYYYYAFDQNLFQLFYKKNNKHTDLKKIII